MKKFLLAFRPRSGIIIFEFLGI